MKYDFETICDRRGTGSRKWMPVEDFEELIVPFSVADMEFNTAPEIKKELINYIENNILGYTTYMDDYLEEVVKWQKDIHDLEIKEEYIVSTPGVVSALYYLILTLTKEDDGIIIFKPVYHPFTASVEAANRNVINCPLINKDGYYKIDFEKFEDLAADPKNKAIIFCNPHNPVGRVWTEDELTKIVEISKKYNILIISDEIWSDITMSGFKTTSILKVAGDYLDSVVVSTAASKTFNLAGLTCSNIIIPNKLIKRAFLKELEKPHLAVPALGFVGTKAAYKYGKDWMKEMINVVEENYKYTKNFFEENINGSVVSPLEGTYATWVDLRSLGLDKNQLEKFLVEKAKFYVNQGYFFGEEGEGFIRINLACPKSVLKDSLNRLKIAIES